MDRDRRGRPIKRQCTGHRKDGGRCRRSANRGTTVCNSHGGAALQVKVAAARRQADAEAAAALARWSPPNGDHEPVDVLGELAKLIARVTSFCDYATARLAALTPEDWAVRSERTEAEVRQFQVAVAQASRLLTDVSRLGLDHLDAVSVARRHGDAVAAVIARVLSRHGFDYRPDSVRAEVAAELRAMPLGPVGDWP